MTKALTHFCVLTVIFFGTWFLLTNVDFIKILRVEQFSKDNEHKLGEFILEAIKRRDDELDSDTVQACLDSIIRRLCVPNNIGDSSIVVHVLINDDVNAFALPDHQLIVYTGLIRYCKSPEELGGVLAHEIAHMEQRHVMKKLVKEVGLTMLTTVAGGESSGEIGRQVVKLLSSSAFDREQESEADVSAVHMMARAGIDPENLANFLFRLSQEKHNIPKNFAWLSTHPDSQDRSAEILKLRKQETFHGSSVTDSDTWATVEKIVRKADAN
jgi:predicted Zn-dependent protease